jgi:protein dpy-30
MAEEKEKWADPEYKRRDQKNMEELERKAQEEVPALPDTCLPTNKYLEKYVLPFIIPALEATAKFRPKNPVEFFSYYLLAQRNTPTQ